MKSGFLEDEFVSIGYLLSEYKLRTNQELDLEKLINLQIYGQVFFFVSISYQNKTLSFTKNNLNPTPIELISFYFNNSRVMKIEDTGKFIGYFSFTPQYNENQKNKFFDIKNRKIIITNKLFSAHLLEANETFVNPCQSDKNISEIKIELHDNNYLELNLLDDIYIIRGSIEDIFRLYNYYDKLLAYYRKKENNQNNENELIENIFYINAENKKINDAKDRIIKTQETLIQGLILALDKRDKKFKYWGRRGINYHGLSKSIIQYLEENTEDHDSIRNVSTYSRTLKKIAKELEEQANQ